VGGHEGEDGSRHLRREDHKADKQKNSVLLRNPWDKKKSDGKGKRRSLAFPMHGTKKVPRPKSQKNAPQRKLKHEVDCVCGLVLGLCFVLFGFLLGFMFLYGFGVGWVFCLNFVGLGVGGRFLVVLISTNRARVGGFCLFFFGGGGGVVCCPVVGVGSWGNLFVSAGWWGGGCSLL